MRMHTIPQNVTAYEDKIVGMLIGRQFIYLAIGGVTIFILLSADIGPLFIRVFVAGLVGLFAAAMALLKLNDRGFDSLMLSYAKAMLGPTEWVWQKNILPMQQLAAVTSPVNSASPAAIKAQGEQNTSQYQQNLQRVSRFQSFISQRETSTLDDSEVQFIEQLNFSEPVPQAAFEAASPNNSAPPMLTKANFSQVKKSTKPDPVVFPVSQAEPLTRIAGNSAKTSRTIALEGRSQNISMRNNQRTNRSLSRNLLSAGVMPLPVRGEIRFDITPELKNELTSIRNTAPVNATPTSTTNLSGYPMPENATKPEPAARPVSPTTTPAPAAPAAQQPPPSHTSIDYAEDWAKKATVRQQIAALGQTTANFGITKGTAMPNTPPAQQQQPSDSNGDHPSSLSTMASGGDVKIIKDSNPGSSNTEITPDLQRQLSQVEGQAKQAISEIDQSKQVTDPQSNPMPQPPEPTQPSAPTQPPTDAAGQVSELNTRAQALAAKAKQVEAIIAQLQQTTLPGQDQTQLTQHQQLLQNIRNEQQQVNAHLQQLDQQPSGSTEHHHTEFQPVQQVPPVLNEQPSAGSTPPPPTLSTPSSQIAQPSAGTAPGAESGLDFQDKMAAAGVGAAGQAAPAAQSSSASSQPLSMTSQPNIINGRVLDTQGQSLPGVVVVVKNSQGEPKRALKTNKLGQFVVTTPLANGSYMVEVDKKGLSFDIMKVELTGAVLAPMEIRSK